MRVLVTGGAGFIGSHLVEKLVHKKYKVTVLDNLCNGSLKNLKLVKNKIRFLKYDLTKKKNLEKIVANNDFVFHLAGLIDVNQSIKYPNKYFKTNVIGTINILNAARKAKLKKFIYAASASCYGNSKEIPTSEKAKINLLSPYASTKWIAEKLIIRNSRINKFPAISLRLFNVYGPRSKTTGPYSGVIGIFMRQAFSKKSLTIVGDGKQTRSFIYVSDVVNAMIKAAKSKTSGEIFNVGAKRSVQVNRIAELVGGKKIHISKRLKETKFSVANIKKIKKKLNWSPRISIDEGIETLYKNKYR